MKIYAGIGSRETPDVALGLMIDIGKALAQRGYMLRSGAAPGADTAFERGCDLGRGDKEIFLPWNGFNSRLVTGPQKNIIHTIPNEAFDMAAEFHPAWDRCSEAAMKLHARNCMQILGRNLNDPVDFVICWTPGGRGTGGTGQALRLAKARGITIMDLGRYDETQLHIMAKAFT